jgi:hypothetical protein
MPCAHCPSHIQPFCSRDFNWNDNMEREERVLEGNSQPHISFNGIKYYRRKKKSQICIS